MTSNDLHTILVPNAMEIKVGNIFVTFSKTLIIPMYCLTVNL